jgi:uncharacterized protein YuzE
MTNGGRMRRDMKYFAGEDILHIGIQPGLESGSVEIYPNITAQLNARGELIGVEIVEAGKYIRDGILEACKRNRCN